MPELPLASLAQPEMVATLTRERDEARALNSGLVRDHNALLIGQARAERELREQLDAQARELEVARVSAEQNAHWHYERASEHVFEPNPDYPDQCIRVIGQVERPWGEGTDRICGLWQRFHLASDALTRLAEAERRLGAQEGVVEAARRHVTKSLRWQPTGL